MLCCCCCFLGSVFSFFFFFWGGGGRGVELGPFSLIWLVRVMDSGVYSTRSDVLCEGIDYEVYNSRSDVFVRV